jgi:hypothetical protein
VWSGSNPDEVCADATVSLDHFVGAPSQTVPPESELVANGATRFQTGASPVNHILDIVVSCGC